MDVNLRAKHTKAALSAVRNRSNLPPPTIDFTVHVQDDGSSVSTKERIIKEVQAPAFFKPTDEQFYSDSNHDKPDIAFLKNHFYREGRLTDDQVRYTPCHHHLALPTDYT
jgi:serine/threonine-protein phosphatase 2B catalytic subunit